jgi:hypothetical protein
MEVRGDQPWCGIPGKRLLPGQGFIQHTGQRVDINATVLLGPAMQPFRAM